MTKSQVRVKFKRGMVSAEMYKTRYSKERHLTLTLIKGAKLLYSQTGDGL